MSCFSPDYQKISSSRPKKAWKGLISALQKKVTNAKNTKPFNRTTANYTSMSSYHRHFHYQINPEPLVITGVSLRVSSDDTYAVLQGKNGGVEDLEDDNDDEGGVIVSNESVKLHGDVDANAEEFIEKMREYWKLERQKSVENYMEMVSRFYEH